MTLRDFDPLLRGQCGALNLNHTIYTAILPEAKEISRKGAKELLEVLQNWALDIIAQYTRKAVLQEYAEDRRLRGAAAVVDAELEEYFHEWWSAKVRLPAINTIKRLVDKLNDIKLKPIVSKHLVANLEELQEAGGDSLKEIGNLLPTVVRDIARQSIEEYITICAAAQASLVTDLVEKIKLPHPPQRGFPNICMRFSARNFAAVLKGEQNNDDEQLKLLLQEDLRELRGLDFSDSASDKTARGSLEGVGKCVSRGDHRRRLTNDLMPPLPL